MGERTSYTHGHPCYIDLMTPDFEASCKLYCDLLGLETREQDIPNGRYAQLLKDGKVVCGVGYAPEEQSVPTCWNTYINVADVEAAVAKVQELGGTVMMPVMDVMTHGRMAGIQDCCGAAFFLWQAKDAIGSEVVNVEGGWSWSELWAKNSDSAQKFYGDLFGWSFDEWKEEGPEADGPPKPPYYTIKDGDRMLAGQTSLTDEMQGVPPHWATYFAVEDADATAEKLKAASGQVLYGPFDMSAGRMFVAQDPQGAAVSFIKSAGPMDP